MSEAVAVNIVVLGRGLRVDGSDFHLSEASKERVRALVNYIEANVQVFTLQPARVIFSGGWGAAAAKLKAPPDQCREAALMLKYAHALPVNGNDFSSYAHSDIEIQSNSTLENMLRMKEAGYFNGASFTAANPLGIVAHADHQKRIDYFIGKVFEWPRSSILHITAHGDDDSYGVTSEKILYPLSRLAFIGANDHSVLRRRQSLALNVLRHLPTRASNDRIS